MKVKFYGLILIICLFSNATFAVKEISDAQLKMRNPVHSSSEAVEIAKAYLIKEHKVTIKNYKLCALWFEYFNQWESNESLYAGEWHVGFELASSPPYPGSGFLVTISNSKKPKVELIPSE